MASRLGEHSAAATASNSVSQSRWWFAFDDLPPNVNHQYVNRRGGRKALTAKARAQREAIAIAAGATGFRVRPTAVYAVRVAFIFPSWQHDLDGPLKSLLDAIFGTRWDHRVVRLEADKIVEPGTRYTEVEITERAPDLRASPVRATSYKEERT